MLFSSNALNISPFTPPHLFSVDCCTHSTTGWAAFVCFISGIALLWTAQVVMTLKLYVVADTLSAWYFCPSGTTDPMYLPSARRGLRHGLTSSFGSICFAGLILALIKILRDAMNKAQDNAQVRAPPHHTPESCVGLSGLEKIILDPKE